MLKINNLQVAEPSKMNQSFSDIEGSSYINAKGKTLRDLTRRDKRELSFEWKGLDVAEARKLLLNCSAQSFVSVYYFDAYDGNYRTANFKVTDRSADFYSLNSSLPTYATIQLSFEEE